MTTALTKGPHHIGLTVSKLEESARFFTGLLGWEEVRRVPDYPAIFVSDGNILLTLWAAKTQSPEAFDRRANIGLHHLAFRVEDEQTLVTIHQRLKDAGVPIEFGPQPVGDNPARHMMCSEPSGVRVEFFWPGS